MVLKYLAAFAEIEDLIIFPVHPRKRQKMIEIEMPTATKDERLMTNVRPPSVVLGHLYLIERWLSGYADARTKRPPDPDRF